MSGIGLNLKDLIFMVADSNENIRSIVHGVLRGFGATNVIEAADGEVAQRDIRHKHVDLLFCEINLPKIDGFSLIKTLRDDAENPMRFIPAIILTSHTQQKYVEKSRDIGANLVIAKPIVARILYDRLSWTASEPRPFRQTPTYSGPDRRFKIEGFPGGVGRRADDEITEIGDEVGPAMSQEEIDSMFN